MNIVPLNYKGEIVSFNTDGWINVTGVAERFGKRIDNWMRLAETLEYVRALDEALTGKESQILHPSQSRYVKTSKARKDRGGGTWLHPKLSVAFARWCDARFAVWCDLHIDSLLRGELTEQQKYEQACRIRDDRKSKASNGAREMARWRWDKPVIEANVEYWREQLQLTLDMAKLKECDVICIRREYVRGSVGNGLRSLAKRYGVSTTMIADIVNHRNWSNVSGV